MPFFYIWNSVIPYLYLLLLFYSTDTHYSYCCCDITTRAFTTYDDLPHLGVLRYSIVVTVMVVIAQLLLLTLLLTLFIHCCCYYPYLALFITIRVVLMVMVLLLRFPAFTGVDAWCLMLFNTLHFPPH